MTDVVTTVTTQEPPVEGPTEDNIKPVNLTPEAIKANIGGSFDNTFTDAASTKASSTVSDDNYQAQACADIEREYNEKIQALANTATTNSSAHKTDANTHIPDGSTDTTDGSTIKEPTEGERMALENYKNVMGTDTTIEAMNKTTKDVWVRGDA